MANPQKLKESGLLIILSFFLFFVSVNINPTLGGIYQGLALLGIIAAIVDYLFGKRSLSLINKKISWGKALIISLVAYILLILGSHLATGLAEVVPLKELLGLLGATAPVFSSSELFNFLIFAVAVPIIETYVIFCVGIDVLASIFKIPTDRRSLFNPKTMVLIIAISIAFLFFHISAKGLENESALILVGIMAFISCILILGFQEFRVAILLHLEANIIASISFFSSVAEKTISNVFVPLINLMPLG